MFRGRVGRSLGLHGVITILLNKKYDTLEKKIKSSR